MKRLTTKRRRDRAARRLARLYGGDLSMRTPDGVRFTVPYHLFARARAGFAALRAAEARLTVRFVDAAGNEQIVGRW